MPGRSLTIDSLPVRWKTFEVKQICKASAVLSTLFFAVAGWSSIDLGSGISSVTSGRMVPGLNVGYTSSNWALSINSIGVSSSYYYQSSYSMNYFWTWQSDQLFWGRTTSGFGFGALYSQRGFQDEGSTTQEVKSDYGLGPSFRVRWFFAQPIYMNMEMLWGLRGTANLALNGQDFIMFSVGVQAW